MDNGANIDDKTSENKTIIQTLLEKEELQKEKQTPENKEAKEDLNLNIEDEKIRTFLQNIKVCTLTRYFDWNNFITANPFLEYIPKVSLS